MRSSTPKIVRRDTAFSHDTVALSSNPTARQRSERKIEALLQQKGFLSKTIELAREKANKLRRRSGQSVTASDFGSNGPWFESRRCRCVDSLDKALYSMFQGEAFTLASISYLAILVKYILAKKLPASRTNETRRQFGQSNVESAVLF